VVVFHFRILPCLLLVGELDAELNSISSLEVKKVGVSEGADSERSEEVLSEGKAENSTVVEASLEVSGLIGTVSSGSGDADLAGLEVVDTLEGEVGVGW